MGKGEVPIVPGKPNGLDHSTDNEKSINTPRSRRFQNSGTLDDQTQKQIGRRLKSLYEDVISQEVPDRFLKLLENIDAEKKSE